MVQKRNLLLSWTEQIIQRLKRNSNYHIDAKLTTSDLLEILSYRGMAALRGFWLGWRIGEVRGNLFVGRKVILRHRRYLKIGRSVILEDYVYIDALSQNGVEIRDNVTIARHSTIQCTGVIQNIGVGIEIGNNSAIGAYSFLGGQGGIKIGENVIMGPKVNIFSENHEFNDWTTPIRLQGVSRNGVIIEDDCWIGANVTIIDGVHLHSGCVVAAGSVVTKDVSPGSVIAGVPAKLINTRKK